MDYIFTSERLGFRQWNLPEDLLLMVEMGKDENVMKYFPTLLTPDQTEEMLLRFSKHYEENNHTYFAVEEISSNNLIGFIGIYLQTYKADFTPAVDIGWRLHPSFWGKGYATEGARACLEYGFTTLGLSKIVAIASKENVASIAVMERLGMLKVTEFIHPALRGNKLLENCVLYELAKT